MTGHNPSLRKPEVETESDVMSAHRHSFAPWKVQVNGKTIIGPCELCDKTLYDDLIERGWQAERE